MVSRRVARLGARYCKMEVMDGLCLLFALYLASGEESGDQ